MAPMEWHYHYKSQVWALHILFRLIWSTGAHTCDLRWGSEIFQAKHEHLQANLKSKSNPWWRPETWRCHNALHFCFLQSSAYCKHANGPAFLLCLSFILVLRIQEWQNNQHSLSSVGHPFILLQGVKVHEAALSETFFLHRGATVWNIQMHPDLESQCWVIWNSNRHTTMGKLLNLLQDLSLLWSMHQVKI